MKERLNISFEEIVKQNEKRIFYQLQRLGIQDFDGEFYAEGLFAMWMAYKKYDTDKGPLATYFNYAIRNRLIDLIRKRVREKEIEDNYMEETKSQHNRNGTVNQQPLQTPSDIQIPDDDLWEKVFSTLSRNQKKWVYYAIIRDLTQKEIAEKENVTIEAVKGWAKGAKKKLRQLWKSTEEIREDML